MKFDCFASDICHIQNTKYFNKTKEYTPSKFNPKLYMKSYV